MRKIFIFILVLFFYFSFGQTYQFDFLTKYVATNSKNKSSQDHVNYFNSDDFNYKLRVSLHDKELQAILSDHETKLAHHFKVIQSNINNEITFKFNYDHSIVIDPIDYDKTYRFEFDEVPESDGKEVVMKLYRTKKSKKPFMIQKLSLIRSNKNLFPMYRLSTLLHFWSYKQLMYSGDFMVSKAVEKNGNLICETNLTEYKNVNFQITLPKELKF